MYVFNYVCVFHRMALLYNIEIDGYMQTYWALGLRRLVFVYTLYTRKSRYHPSIPLFSMD
jgi:hypothetical protein